MALNESVSLCLGIACLACILACVSCGSNDPEGASLGMKSKSAAADSPGSPVDFRPDGAVVVCRDLAGYFRDCGCSGEAGGVAKIPAAALHPGFLSPMFIGNSVVPPVASKDEAALLGELPLIVTATRLVWGAFPHVYWIPGESQPVLEVLLKQDTGLGQYVVKSPIQVGPLIIEISNDSIERDLIVVNGVRVNLPKMPRGREVLVLAWWNEPHPDKSKNAATADLDRTLGALLPLNDQSKPVVDEISRRLMQRKSAVWTYWQMRITKDVADHDKILAAVGQADVLLNHSLDRTPSSQVHDFTLLDEAVAKCAACHASQASAWKLSKHRVSYATLKGRGRQADLRCVPCHTESFAQNERGVFVSEDHGAVTCMTCHRTGDASETCRRCHNEITDPGRNFQKHGDAICSKGLPDSTKPCLRGR